MRLFKVVLAVLVVVGIAAVAYFVQGRMEQYETSIWSGASREARENPYLAAQKFLESRDVKVVSTIDTLDFNSIDTDHIVFLSRVDSMLVSQSQIDTAMSWVNRGGYLLVGVADEIEGQASILKEFDITPAKRDVQLDEAFVDEEGEPLTASERMREVNRKIEEQRAEALKEKDSHQDALGSDDTATDAEDKPKKQIDENDDFSEQLFDLLNIDNDHEYYRVSLGDNSDTTDSANNNDKAFLAVLDRITLDHDLLYVDDALDSDEYDGDYDGDYDEQEYGDQSDTNTERVSVDGDYKLTTWVSDEHGARLLQFEYGAGTFTAISSAEYWENNYIGLADHAYFLSYLVADESTFYLFYNVTAPTLTELVKRYFFELIIASLILLMLWLWRNGVRVQPITTVIDGQRRSFAEHLGASAKFLVTKEQYQVLIEPLKGDIELQMRPFYPNFSQLNEQAQVAKLAERTQFPEHTLQAWVRYSNKVESQDELVAALKIGNAIRKTL